jgi:general transcription factor 3C polypeptide 3 (transcription factor C subunit 4)
VAAQNYPTIVEHCRKIMTVHQFNNEPLRILVAALASGLYSTDAFIVSPLQKAIYREMKLSHMTVKTPELVRWAKQMKRFSIPVSKLEEANDDDDADGEEEPVDDVHPLPDAARKSNPVITALYGQMSVAAKSYQSAICRPFFFLSADVPAYSDSSMTVYLLHAYELCPEDPMICLSLAMASLGRAMQRQSDNRHQLITQVCACRLRCRTCRVN